MTDELLDIIDENNTVIGQEQKSVVHEKGLKHRVSAVLVQNGIDEYLIPTASDIKVEAGGLFHSAAGHVTAGKDYKEAAARELYEETRLDASIDDFELLGSYWLEKEYPTRIERERFEVFKVKYNPIMGQVKFNEEQQEEQWFSEEELRDIYMNDRDKLSYPLQLSCKYIFHFE